MDFVYDQHPASPYNEKEVCSWSFIDDELLLRYAFLIWYYIFKDLSAKNSHVTATAQPCETRFMRCKIKSRA